MVDISIWRWYGLVVLLLSLPFRSYGKPAQATDIFEKPTSKKVEANTTFFITPRDIKQNYRQYHRIDLSIAKMDRFTVSERYHYNFQNLGNHWTAGQYILYRMPQHIGAIYGTTVYDFYFQQPSEIRYYRMPGAYAYFNIILANISSFIFNSCYSQRLLDNWYIGANCRGAMTENEWPIGKDDKIVRAFPHFDVFTHISLLDGCYHVFTSFSNMSYETRETGGVRSEKGNSTFKFRDSNPSQRYRSSLLLLEEPYMVNKISNKNLFIHKDLRRNLYLYHQYEFDEQLQLYHELHYNRKNNIATIKSIDNDLLEFIAEQGDEKLFHRQTENSTISNITMHSLEHEIGVKGDIANNHLFYAFYYKHRNIVVHDNFPNVLPSSIEDPVALHLVNRKTQTPPQTIAQGKKNEQEHYLGYHTRLNWAKNNLHKVELDGAYLFHKAGYYNCNLSYQNSFVKLSCHAVKHKIPYVVQYGYSSYRKWQNDFVAPSAKQLVTEIYYAFPYLSMHPMLSLSRIYNYIYYSKVTQQDRLDHCISEPIQATTPIDLISWGGHLNFCFFSHFHFDHTLTFLHEISSGSKIFKGYIPPYLYTIRYYYAAQPFSKKMDIETGFNIHFKDLYYADGYDVVAQQFYRQNKFAVQGRPILDFFINYRINNLKISLKYSYLNENMHTPNAYFGTPFYPYQKKAADIGIHWSFFD